MSPPLLRIAGDERLARMVTAGHDPAFATLYDRYHDVLVRYCRSLVRDDQDALDAFQSTMLNALRALREGRRSAPVRPWLFRIAHNESISMLRRRPASEPLDDRHVASVDVHRTAEDREALAGLLEDLGGLTDHQRSALLLRELGGLAYDDVAGVLDTTPLAARQAVFAARASLHEQREGRELACAIVQRRLSDADRRAARTRAIRAHVRGCDDCRGFAAAIGRRRAAILLPLPPTFASGGLLVSILDGAGGPATTGGGAVAAGVVAKAAVALSAAVVATGAAERPRPAAERATTTRTTTATTRSASTARTVAGSGVVQLASVLPTAEAATPAAEASTPQAGATAAADRHASAIARGLSPDRPVRGLSPHAGDRAVGGLSPGVGDRAVGGLSPEAGDRAVGGQTPEGGRMAMAMRARRRRTDEGPKPGFVTAAEPSAPAQVVPAASSPDTPAPSSGTPAPTSDTPAATTAEPQTTATQTVPATTDDDTATAQSPPAS
jgi:RNA polymerase sigma factor (sigma-70 family)